MRTLIENSTLTCRAHWGLPLDGPVAMPSDAVLVTLSLQERETFFDGANHAEFITQRMVAADPRSSACAVRVFHYRTARAGQVCGTLHIGSSTPLGPLTNATSPEAPSVTQGAQRDNSADCGRPARPDNIEGLPRIDAGAGVRCVWQLDILANTMRGLGITVPGHKDSSPLDFCLYEGQPNYVHRGKQTPVVVRVSGQPELDRMNILHGGTTAQLGQQLLSLSDGKAIAPSRFSADAVRAHVSQPAITVLGD
jgi:hypothetical protein